MDFLQLAKSRYSCRKYQDKPIEKEVMTKVLEAGRVAPSAKNNQPWRFVVIDDKDLLAKIKSCYQREWIQSAPCVIAVCGNHMQSWRRADGKDHCDIDISIAIDHMTLAATDNGLGTCWVCKFDSMKAAEILHLPDGVEAIALLPIGYPADKTNHERHNTLRKPLNEVVSWNKF